MKKVLALIGIGVILCGCQGPQIQKAVQGLNADADSIAAQVIAGDPLLTTVADLEKKAGEKLSEAQRDSLLAKISETHTAIAAITALKAKVTVIRDSLSTMEDKATGKAKDDITALKAKLDEIFSKIAGFTDASMKLDAIKAKLEKVEEKAPTKAAIKPAPEKKVAPPAPKRK